MGPKEMESPILYTCKEKRTERDPWERFLILVDTACSEAEAEAESEPFPLPHPTPTNQQGETKKEEEEKSMAKKKGDDEQDMGHIKKGKKEKGKEIMDITPSKTMPMIMEKKMNDPELAPLSCGGLVDLHRMMVFKKDTRLFHVCEKRLRKTDVDRHQNRLLLPTEDARGRLVPAFGLSLEDEMGILQTPGIKAVGLDPMRREWKLNWKYWTKYHVLDGEWKNLVEFNGLQAGLHTVLVSAFCYREGNEKQICFVIDTRSCSGYAASSSQEDHAIRVDNNNKNKKKKKTS